MTRSTGQHYRNKTDRCEELSVFVENGEGGVSTYQNIQAGLTNTCSATIVRSVESRFSHTTKLRGRKSVCDTSYPGFLSFLCGLGNLLVGFLLGVGWFSVRNTTSSQENVEYKIPTYVSASIMVVSGILAIISSRKRFKYLVLLVVFLSIVCTMFCFVSFIYLSTEVNMRFNHLEDCSFLPLDQVCQCYVPENGGRKLMRFKSVRSCDSVQENLRELVYGVCVLFGIGFVISAVSAIASSYLLYTEQKRRSQSRVRTSGDGSIHMNSITTQTQESCFQVQSQTTMLDPGPSERTVSERTDRRNLSVATQTPIYMMPVAQLVYDMNQTRGDFHVGLLMPAERDEPPPPYSDAVVSP